MPELPDRPDLDQLRRQARELLRAAANDDPGALARLRVVSDQTTLSAAQLAVAREHGYPSWPALKAETERRRRSAPAANAGSPGRPDRPVALDEPRRWWTFGHSATIETAAGVLHLEQVTVTGEGLLCQGQIRASLMPAADLPAWPAATPRRPPAPGTLLARWMRPRQRRRAAEARNDPTRAVMRLLLRSGDIAVADDEGARYEVRGVRMPAAGPPGTPLTGPVPVSLRLDPVPGPQVAWLEVCGADRSCRAYGGPGRDAETRPER